MLSMLFLLGMSLLFVSVKVDILASLNLNLTFEKVKPIQFSLNFFLYK